MSSDKFEKHEQKVSYGIGLQMGDQLLNNGFEGLDVELVIEGLRDLTEGKEPQVSNDDLRASFQVISEIQEANLVQGQLRYIQVIDVRENSEAWQAGLKIGDIIYAINKEVIDSFDSLFEAVERNRNNLLLNIQRNGRELYLLLK